MELGIQVRSCNPICLTVIGIGPFQEKPFTLDFTNKTGEGCNFYFIISPNGHGKTTLMETMASLMQLLDNTIKPVQPHERLWSNPKAKAQLDFRLVVNLNGTVHEMLLTLAAGAGRPYEIHPWRQSKLKEVQTERNIHVAWVRSAAGSWKLDRSTDRILDELLGLISMEMENVYELFGPDNITVPSLLYFDAYRDIPIVTDQKQTISRPPEWLYRPIHRFGLGGDLWQQSIDNLLVWLTWLEDERYEETQKLINRLVFSGTEKSLASINRQQLHARISMGGSSYHRLDQLSSGEKSLLQLLLRIHLHLTSHAWVLIDELDAHLHVKLQHRLYQALKQLVAENPSLTIIASTHSRELIDQFAIDMEDEEPGLRLGGYLIEKDEL